LQKNERRQSLNDPPGLLSRRVTFGKGRQLSDQSPAWHQQIGTLVDLFVRLSRFDMWLSTNVSLRTVTLSSSMPC